MIAGIRPNAGGWLGIVVTDSAEPPYRPVIIDSLPVGQLVRLAEPVDGRDMRRDVSDADLSSLTSSVMDRIAGCDVVYIEHGGEGIGSRVVTAIGAACALSDIDLVVVSAQGHTLRSSTRERLRRMINESFSNWPELTYGNQDLAAACLLRGLGLDEAQGKKHRARRPRHRVELITPAEAASAIANGSPITTSDPEPVAAPAVIVPSFVGPCRAAIDPGSTWCAVAVADATGALVKSATIVVGHDEKLAKARRVRRGDKTYEFTHKHTMSMADIEDAVAAIDEIVRPFGITRVAIEYVEAVYLTDIKTAASISSKIARAQWLGGALHIWFSSTTDAEVRLVTSRRWMSKIAGIQKGKRGRVAEVVEARWPSLGSSHATEHERDASGLLAYDIDYPEDDRPKEHVDSKSYVARRPTVAKQQTPRDADGHTEAQSKRISAGCSCTSARHRKGCPLYVEKKYVTRAMRRAQLVMNHRKEMADELTGPESDD